MPLKACRICNTGKRHGCDKRLFCIRRCAKRPCSGRCSIKLMTRGWRSLNVANPAAPHPGSFVGRGLQSPVPVPLSRWPDTQIPILPRATTPSPSKRKGTPVPGFQYHYMSGTRVMKQLGTDCSASARQHGLGELDRRDLLRRDLLAQQRGGEAGEVAHFSSPRAARLRISADTPKVQGAILSQ